MQKNVIKTKCKSYKKMSQRFVCSGDSCCLMPSFNFAKMEQCKNNSVCYKFEVKDSDGFCDDCITNIPLDDKALKMQDNETCDICSKENACCVKRLFCEHLICVVCFRKIYFKFSISTITYNCKCCSCITCAPVLNNNIGYSPVINIRV